MGWALTREENEVINEKDEREGKPQFQQFADRHVRWSVTAIQAHKAIIIIRRRGVHYA
jgi:hypothetical protein